MKPLLALAAATMVLVGCSSDASTASTTSAVGGQSWACIQAVATTGLTTGSLVRVARTRLTQLASDQSFSDDERRYFSDLLAATEGLSDTDPIGDTLDAVPCHAQ